jgi:hypothetical protein
LVATVSIYSIDGVSSAATRHQTILGIRREFTGG